MATLLTGIRRGPSYAHCNITAIDFSIKVAIYSWIIVQGKKDTWKLSTMKSIKTFSKTSFITTTKISEHLYKKKKKMKNQIATRIEGT